jgi:hypothetical protein
VEGIAERKHLMELMRYFCGNLTGNLAFGTGEPSIIGAEQDNAGTANLR